MIKKRIKRRNLVPSQAFDEVAKMRRQWTWQRMFVLIVEKSGICG